MEELCVFLRRLEPELLVRALLVWFERRRVFRGGDRGGSCANFLMLWSAESMSDPSSD